MRKWLLLLFCGMCLCGCRRYEPAPAPDQLKELSEAAEADQNGLPKDVEPEDGNESGPATAAAEAVKPAEPEMARVKVKGIYVSAHVAGTRSMMDEIISRINETEINAVVIDVKEDEGRVTYAMDVPLVVETGASVNYISDLSGLIGKLKAQGIYVIGRVVAFRDPYLAEVKPQWSLKTKDGKIYRDSQGLAWIDPYRKEVWEYLTQIGEAAADDGFDEIQFDYIRFSAGKGMEDVVIPEEEMEGLSRTDIITEFTRYARERLEPKGVFVSADVFGTIIESTGDADIVGQNYGAMAAELDYICPMIYPSHYGDGNFGLDHPDLYPYETISAALKGSKRVLEEATPSSVVKKKTSAIVRPWLQDFTASYLTHHITYGPDQLRQQIQAVYDAGYEEWLLWDAKCTYTWDGLLPAEE